MARAWSMTETTSEVWPIESAEDVVKFRQAVKRVAVGAGFGVIDQTKIVTATSELARNALDYGGGGSGVIDILSQLGRTGLRVVVRDSGPGIADLSVAMQDGYTSGSGMGLGLGGAKRLVNEFDIQSQPDHGTVVTIVRWR